jgi:antitoxin (DNA-binding transcriptional repressor) of toxin-antitoxin stability system
VQSLEYVYSVYQKSVCIQALILEIIQLKPDRIKLRNNSSTPQVGAFEAKNTLGTLLDRVERGEEIVITRHASWSRGLYPTREESTESGLVPLLKGFASAHDSCTNRIKKSNLWTGRP